MVRTSGSRGRGIATVAGKRARWNVTAGRMLALALLAAAMAVFTACGSSGDDSSGASGGGSSAATSSTGSASSDDQGGGETTLRVAISVPKNTNNGEQAARWAQDVSDASDGRIKLEVHYGDLGGDAQIPTLMRQGTLDGAFTATSTLSNLSPPLALFDLPFLFSNYDQVYAVEDGPVGQSLLEGLGKFGLVGLDYSDLGFRNFANNKHAINTPADLDGLKFRILEGPIPSETFKSLGATPVPLDPSEIYTSLQQGVVDGLDMPVPYFLTAKLYEVVKYYSLSRNTFTGMMFLLTRKAWDKLSPEDQRIVRDATHRAALWGRRYDKDLEESGLRDLRAKGVVINDIADLQAFRDKVQPVYDQAGPKIGKDVIDQAQQAIDKAGS